MLIGARQSGKSTLARALVGGGGSYLSLDDAAVLATARNDPMAFIYGREGTMVIDEVQRVPELFMQMKLSVDRDRRPGRFLVTGSANPLFGPEAAEALAGRMEVLKLWPLSAAEIEGRPDIALVRSLLDENLSPPDASPVSREALAARVLRGGFPEAVEREDPDRRARWFSSYITTILEREVRALVDIARLEQLPAILTYVALRSRGALNRSALGQDLSIPSSSIDRYLTLLERVFLIRRLPAWHNRHAPRLVKSPKLLLCDSGLFCHLLQLEGDRLLSDSTSFGLALETFVGMELAKAADVDADAPRLLHYKTFKGAEVDFILEGRDGRVAAIEVKSSSSIDAADFRRFHRLREVLGTRFIRGVVFYTGEHVLPFGDRLEAWPVSTLWGSNGH
jgi:uncharacterized protein